MELSVTTNSRQFKAAMAAIPPRLFRELHKAVELSMLRFVQKMRTSRMSGRPGVERQTGKLSSSLAYRVIGTSPGSIRGEAYFGPDVQHYASIQEFGGVITAKRAYASLPGGPYLAVPLFASTPGSKRGPRDFPNTHLENRGGKWFVVEDDTERFLFVLKKSVTIPPRLGFYATWRNQRLATLNTLRAAVRRGLRPTAGVA